MSSIVIPSVADATILHQVSHEEEDDTAAAIANNNNNNNLSQHSTIQHHPSTTSLNAQVVNSMSNEEQIGLSLSPSPPSTSTSNKEIINEIANQVSSDILSTVVNSTVEQQTADNSIVQPTNNNSNQINAEGGDITASLLPKPRQQQQHLENTQNNTGTSTQNSITQTVVEEVNSTMYDQQSTLQRIQTLELNINTLTELCQSLLLQQQHQQYQHQQQQGRIRHHSREGSEVSI